VTYIREPTGCRTAHWLAPADALGADGWIRGKWQAAILEAEQSRPNLRVVASD
jgi:hypothetical protein